MPDLNEQMREALAAIADGEGDAQVIAQQTLAALSRRPAAEQPAAAGNALTVETILRLVCDHTGKRISLNLEELDQHIAFARAIEQHLRAAPQAAPDGWRSHKDQNLPECGTPCDLKHNDGTVIQGATLTHKESRDVTGATWRKDGKNFQGGWEVAEWRISAAQGEGPKLDDLQTYGSPHGTLVRLADVQCRIAAHTRASDGSVTLMNAATGVIAAWDSSPVNNRDSLVTERMYELRQARDAVLQQAASNSAEGAHGEAK